jgi:predicted dehydrogenase
MIRLALVGCGEHSRGSHAIPLARYRAEHSGEISLVAACDLIFERAEEFCRSYGFAKAYSKIEAMLAEEKIDGCVCFMPVEQISRVGIEMLKRGIPCVIEKPLGASVEEACRLLEVARETRTPHLVSVNRRFMPQLNRAISWTQEAGPLRFVRGVMFRHARRETDFIWATAIHGVDTLRYLAGDVLQFKTTVQAGAETSSYWYSIGFRFQSGAIGQLDILPTAGMVEEAYELVGENFRASVLSRPGFPVLLQCWRENKLALEVTSNDEPDDITSGAYAEVKEFVRGLKTKSPLKPAIEDVYPSVELCFQIAELINHS